MQDAIAMTENTACENLGQEKTARLDREELSEGWAEVGRVPQVVASIKMGAKTDLGRVRDNNEDKFDFFEPEDPAVLATKGCFYAVADGMGGHSAGQIACELALKTVIQTYYANPSSDTEASLRHAVKEANSLIYDTAQTIPDRQGMGTTLTAAIVREDRITIAQVGDSRAYLLRGGKITQITEDHSWVAEQVRLGTMTLAEAQVSPFRNIITRSIGTSATVEPDVVTHDVCLSATRSCSAPTASAAMWKPFEMQAVVQEHSPSVAAMSLVEFANERGGRDNITAVVLAVRALTPFGDGLPSGTETPLPTAGGKEEKTSRWGRGK